DLDSWLIGLDEHSCLLSSDLTFVGLLGLRSQMRSGIEEAVRSCEEAGVKVRVFTGEQVDGGKLAAETCSLLQDGSIVTAAEWRRLSDQERAAIAPSVRVMTGASSEEKAELVRCLQERGEVVGASCQHLEDLRVREQADVTIAMRHQGDEVVRQEADLISLNDSLSSVASVLYRGRRFHQNLHAYLEYRTNFNIVAPFACFLAALGGVEIFLPEQMLWMKVVVDVLSLLCVASVDRLPYHFRSHEAPRSPYRRNVSLLSGKCKGRLLVQAGSQCLLLSLLSFTGAS
ncbi:hypothetical protein GUITHDRAFT_40848, partial [Guillardia theta CCMP2712]